MKAVLFPRFLLLGGSVALVSLVLLACNQPGKPAGERPIRIALTRAPALLDPHLQFEMPAFQILGNVYDFLVLLDPQLRPIPSLAQRWENPDPLTWRFHLRRNVTFHDGQPLEAADVTYSLNRAMQPKSSCAGLLAGITEIRRIDESTVEVRTKAPNALLLNKLALIGIVPRDSPDLIAKPTGSGPFRIVELTSHFISLEVFPGHWRLAENSRPRRYPQRAIFYYESNPETRTDLLLNRNFDLIEEFPLARFAEVNADPDLRADSVASVRVNFLRLNTGRSPWSHPQVRQAVDLLLDRAELVRLELGGHGEELGQLAPRNVFGFNPQQPLPKPDVTTARRLLAEAGFTNGIEMEILHREGSGIEHLRQQLALGGFQVSGQPQPWPQVWRRLGQGDFDVSLDGLTFGSGDASDLLDLHLHSVDLHRGLGPLNFAKYTNPRLDALIAASHHSSSELERGELLQRAMALAQSEHVLIPLYSTNTRFGRRRELDWTPRPDGRIFVFELRWRSTPDP